MSLWSRIANALRPGRLDREIEAELEAHIAEAIAAGRDPQEARHAFGSLLRHREESRDVGVVRWLDSLRADAVFGWRQLAKRKVTSAAAILSLALTIGACSSAFRLVDAVLLRPLPVDHPEQLYDLSLQGMGPEGKAQILDQWSSPMFRQLRATARGQAELMAVSAFELADVTYASDQEMEKAHLQYVSGNLFGALGLRPAAGRLLGDNDDVTAGAHTVAVLSYDYWSRRFGRDPNAIGRTFHLADRVYEIIGVVDAPFTGTEPGTMTDLFVPSMMHPWALRSDATNTRILARIKPGVALDPLREKLHAAWHAAESDRLASSMSRAKGAAALSQRTVDHFLDQALLLEPASAGVSGMQRTLRLPLTALAVLVALVLLIACANVANLMTAQAVARSREMALRVSIGAGRRRLVQLVLVESALLALLAAVSGGLFAWWSAPFVVSRINPPDNPARLSLPADWRVLGFSLALTLAVTILFGLAPALRASSVKPASALKGGDSPHSRARLMHGLIALQVAFCFLVLFGAGLFTATFNRLVRQPTGFSADRILVVDTVAAHPQPPVSWEQVADHLRTLPGIETVAIADWTLLNGNSRNNFLSINGAPPTETLTYFRYVSPGWLDAMKIPLLDGRDFRPGDTSPGEAIVNETFAKTYLDGRSPVGSWFTRGTGDGGNFRYQIVGMVRDVRYRDLREPILAVAFIPFHAVDSNGAQQPVRQAVFIVRTRASNPLALASAVRREIPRARPEFRVTNVGTQSEIDSRQTIRERLLAMLGLFFAGVALLLSGVGLYGVLDYSVQQRRREIGIRLAIGAGGSDIAWGVVGDVFLMVSVGAAAGVAGGIATVRHVQSLLYGVTVTDPFLIAFAFGAIVAATLLASVSSVIRALRIDPSAMLRAE